jgi:hypothetical protein
MTAHLIAEAVVAREPFHAQGELVDIGDEKYFKISNCDAMAPFLMSLVSSSDLWMFASSTGALTAGRRDVDNALFPYYTDDKIHDSVDITGAKTIIRATRGVRTGLWEPLSPRFDGLYRVVRSLYKSVYGNKLIFEEINHDLGLAFTSSWMLSDRFGFIRRASLRNLAADPVEVVLVDGIQNILPSGLTQRFQLEYSTLADGYKENELHLPTGLGLFRLSSLPADRPLPRESLRATAVWCEGIEPLCRLLCAAQLDRFRHGEALENESLVRGQRGAYFVQTALTLTARQKREWSLVADVSLDAAGVAATVALLESGADLRAEIDRDVAAGTEDLVRIVGGADGLQKTKDGRNVWRHYSNTLFNVMRGGIPEDGYRISREDFSAFVAAANRPLAEKHAPFLAALPQTVYRDDLLDRVRRRNDANLERLAYEYLPLTFSRRHGDPSRPWNIFTIDVKGVHGERVLNYQGNWRDIFQNWEALAYSFPGFVENMIFKFLDASTADGYNPFRITRDGFDWEVLDPHDTWSYIGYWGDHQVAYLPRLLEVAARFYPETLPNLLTRRVFTYADVPYRIKSYEAILKDPHATIDFDEALDRHVRLRAKKIGADGKALPAADGAPYQVNLAEKLIVVILARLFNFVPEAGLWMNTQRPEWNDANNALVGNGVSMVTLCYLRRFLAFTRELFAGCGVPAVEVSMPVATAFARVAEILHAHVGLLEGGFSDENRKTVLDALGQAGSAYRRTVYARGLFGNVPVSVPALIDLCDTGILHIDHAIRASRRPDGLYHAYNILEFGAGGIAIRRLQEMLEGQVAVLSSGALKPDVSSDLLDALRRSRLYRPDQNSYLLYPDKTLPGFLQKNNIPAEGVASCRTLIDMIAHDDRRIVVQDVNGVAHFSAAFFNVSVLEQALVPLALTPEERARILALYEEVFHHKSFTGRSGSFYKYEGLGSIYWHMVSKLLLSVQEVMWRTTDRDTLERLRRQYNDIREGIGTHKSPSTYGAVPLDPYSHTPGFAGVQQPGMTGQVKEDVISRFGEMGASVDKGCLVFSAAMIKRDELLGEAARFEFFDVEGVNQSLDLAAGSLAFTICQVPVVVHESGAGDIEITAADGTCRIHAGLRLDAETSRAIFQRSGSVRRLDVRMNS